MKDEINALSEAVTGESAGKAVGGFVEDHFIDDISGYLEDKYSEEYENLGLTGDAVKTMYEFAKEGDISVSSDLNLIYDLVDNTDAFNNLKDTNTFKNIGKVKNFYETYGSDLSTMYNSMETLKKTYDKENHRYDPEGMAALEDFTKSFLSVSESMMGATIAGDIYGSVMDGIEAPIDDGFRIFRNTAIKYDVYDFLPDVIEWYDSDWKAKKLLDEIVYDKKPNAEWEDGPSLAEIAEAMKECGDSPHMSVIEPYLRWRLQYETQQALEASGYVDTRSPGQKIKDAYRENYSIKDAASAVIDEFKDCHEIGKEAIDSWMETAAVEFWTNWYNGGGEHIVDTVMEYRDNWLIGKAMIDDAYGEFKDNWNIGANMMYDEFLDFAENWYYGAEEINENWLIGADMIGDFFAEGYSNWEAGWDMILGTFRKNENDINTASKMKYDPLILDLAGDGFNVASKVDGTHFDLDVNGYAEKINWTKTDGYLCLDLNGNNKIDNGRELFGDSTLLEDNKEAKNGFEALAQYDLNGDGVIDSNDEIFDKLKIWVDTNGNGDSTGELVSLKELGIISISLNFETNAEKINSEAHITDVASVVFEDGTIRNIGELWVSADLYDTISTDSNVVISDEISALPNVRGFGNIRSLHDAMALDETGRLKTLVEKFTSTYDVDAKKACVTDILYMLCGAEEISEDSRGKYIDAKHLAVIETAMGKDYYGANGKNPNSLAAPKLEEIFDSINNMYFNLINAEASIKPYIALLRCKVDDNGNRIIDTSLVQSLIDVMYKSGFESSDHDLYSIASFLKSMNDSGVKGYDNFIIENISKGHTNVLSNIANFVYSDENNVFSGGNSTDFFIGNDVGEVVQTSGGNDIIIAGKGIDTLKGGQGSDTYIFNLGDGNDVIDEKRSNGKDKVVFGEGIKAEDVKVTRDGNDMVLVVGSKGDTLRITSQYTDSYSQIESFEFADGTVKTSGDYFNSTLTMKVSGKYSDPDDYAKGTTIIIGSEETDEIHGNGRTDIIYGGKGTDKLYGESGNDELHGDTGNDELYGGNGDDTYVFNLGDGNDVIDEKRSLGKDKVVFGEGIKAEDVKVTRDGNDMVLVVGSEGDTLRITSQYTDSYSQIESFEFADGTIAHIALNTSEFVIDVEGTKDEVENALTKILSNIYSEDTLNYELSIDDTIISEVTESTTIANGTNEIADMTDIQLMVLTENMSAFADEANVYDTANIIDTTTDTALNQLLVNSAV